ncbi:hypothetical protein [Acidibrevibacterium fodinaquatile]|uniref:hypothetical protein n=1 Tax=Acidibrevibacterium fodinaquatile TaxID=1969806 RepID=UPI000E0DC26D|nr:hypothetical protein [Acidibrevibacterium fodinaquatile]
MEPLSLAAAAIRALLPYLAKIGAGAATEIGKEAGGALLGWLRAKLGERGGKALADLADEPNNADKQTALREQLAEALQANPALARELVAMLPADARGTDIMTQTVSGAGAKGAQAKGSGNNITIN